MLSVPPPWLRKGRIRFKSLHRVAEDGVRLVCCPRRIGPFDFERRAASSQRGHHQRLVCAVLRWRHCLHPRPTEQRSNQLHLVRDTRCAPAARNDGGFFKCAGQRLAYIVNLRRSNIDAAVQYLRIELVAGRNSRVPRKDRMGGLAASHEDGLLGSAGRIIIIIAEHDGLAAEDPFARFGLRSVGRSRTNHLVAGRLPGRIEPGLE